MTDSVHYQAANGIATVIIDRPDALNALDPAGFAALSAALEQAEHDAAVRCVLIRGAGAHFCAGGELTSFAALLDDDPAVTTSNYRALVHAAHRAIHAIGRMAKPVIAQVQGACAGYGLSLMLACDFAYAAERSTFSSAYANLGATPDGGATLWLAEHLSPKQAAEIMMLGDRFDTATALRLGLINRALPGDTLEAETQALAARLAAGPTAAYANGKRLLAQARGDRLAVQLDREAESFATLAAGTDLPEGIRAFVARRKPHFTGR